MGKVLILKDNYNSFERYYLEHLNAMSENVMAMHYYASDSKIRKLFTHYGLPLESIWYGEWKRHIQEYDLVIVFDSIHTPNLLKYLHKKQAKRIVFWHWNPIQTDKDKYIFEKTQTICEHWTFNDADAEKYGMKHNNQFFFSQPDIESEKTNSVFFVGKDKGRYNSIINIAKRIRENGYEADFHVIVDNCSGLERRDFLQENYMEYDDVLEHIIKSKAILEITQNGQTGLTARTLEAMFLKTKLITNNSSIINCSFYEPDNIFVIGHDDLDDLEKFIVSRFSALNSDLLFLYSAEGWLSHFGYEIARDHKISFK